MRKQRSIVYLALLAALGGLLIAGAPVDRILFLGLFGFMVMMHLGGHGGHGGHGSRGGHGNGGQEGRDTNEHPARHGHVTPAPHEDEVAGQ